MGATQPNEFAIKTSGGADSGIPGRWAGTDRRGQPPNVVAVQEVLEEAETLREHLFAVLAPLMAKAAGRRGRPPKVQCRASVPASCYLPECPWLAIEVDLCPVRLPK
ncbi:MAG TPA: hypothetical protein VF175_16960 [Lacipirellula sp.]